MSYALRVTNGASVRGFVVLLVAASMMFTTFVVAVPADAADLDPLRSEQWGLDTVRADAAYGTTGTGSGVVIAVVDSGVDLDHPDLVGHLVPGWDFVDGDATPDDENGHGTHVAGIAAAVTGNGVGIAGAAPDAKIMPIRVLGASGSGSTDDVALGIDWAVDHGADVINLSLGGGTDLLSRIYKSGPMNDAIKRAENLGVLVVAAAGNDDTFILAYKRDTPVLVVNASNRLDQAASFTSFGDPRAVAAPGTGMLSTAPLTPTTIWPLGSATGYEELSGTSMSTPLVAGIAALMMSGNTPSQVRQAIRETADNPTEEPRLGAGIVNAEAAVLYELPPWDSGDSVGVVDRTSGVWYLRRPDAQTTSFYFGNPGDSPIVGDWNCDGVDTPGLYRQSDGYVYLRNTNTQGIADISFFFGNPGDVPLAGDFNGDGCDTVSIYRPSEARFFIINELGTNDGGLGAAEFDFYFGDSGDKPFTGDFDDNGQDTVGLYRESTGFVYGRNTLTTGIADNEFFYGNPGDQIIAGRWAQNPDDGPDTVGIYRPSQGHVYLRFSNTQGNADIDFPYGNSDMTAVSGYFGDLAGDDPNPSS